MKRLGRLWPQLIEFENLLSAWQKARRGKRQTPEAARFEFYLEKELIRLQRQLQNGDYRPGSYRLFTIYERKPRQIAAAPFRDRVVHHAIMNCIEPGLDPTFIQDSYACRKGKGVHQAVNRYQTWARRYAYALKLDVVQYFASIDHQILKHKLYRRIKDKQVLCLLDTIIDGSPIAEEGDAKISMRKGIPIGNLTSQFFANLYLDDLDHYVQQELKVHAYLRYVDDMVILDDDKSRLHDIRSKIEERLGVERLRLHPRKAQVSPVTKGLNLLGYLVYPASRRLRNDNGHRFYRRLRGFAEGYNQGRLDFSDFDPSVQSWIGHAIHADTYGLRRTIFSNVVFRRGTDQEAVGA